MKLTKFQALFIKLLRIKYGYSWRKISVAFQARYLPKDKWLFNPEISYSSRVHETYDYPDGCQIEGMKLCADAMSYLGETEKDGW